MILKTIETLIIYFIFHSECLAMVGLVWVTATLAFGHAFFYRADVIANVFRSDQTN